MSAYSMPLWTILTKWPAPFAPMYVQQVIAEAYTLLREGLGATPAQIADIFAAWNEGEADELAQDEHLLNSNLDSKDSQSDGPSDEILKGGEDE